MNEIYNEDMLNDICEQYDFSLIGLTGTNYVIIKSKQDTWYIPNKKYIPDQTKIRLLHANRFGSAGWHYQGTFKTYEDMFEYIDGHDKKYKTSYNEVFSMAARLKNIKKQRREPV